MTAKVVAIDGTAASGKGTLGRRLAAHFNVGYLDTGKLYRAVAYNVLQENASPDDEEISARFAHSLKESDLHQEGLTTETVGKAASIISAHATVREALMAFQRGFASHPDGAVLDGRDIGTVICPEANFKFYITATLEQRAKRRFEELTKNAHDVTYDDVYNDLESRDRRDSSRDIAPLQKAQDAIEIDTTDLNAEEVFAKALSYLG